MSKIELLATIALFLNLYLAARASIWNWFFGAMGVALYFIVFVNAGLYADAGLQVVYLGVQWYGWYAWRQPQQQVNIIASMPPVAWLIATVAVVNLDLGMMYLLRHYTDSSTVVLDALNTSLCLIAQWMMIRKWIESWWVWCVANLVAIDMYLTKSLYLTTALYVVFLLFNIYGYVRWSGMLGNAEKKSDPLFAPQ